MARRLEVEGLSLGYGRRHVIENLSMAPVEGGSLTGLVGPNAAGKTTLLRGIAGLLPAEGSIRLDGQELTKLGAAEHATHVTYMPQALPQRVALSVFEAGLSALMSSPDPAIHGAAAREQVMATLDRLGIADLAMRGLDELSGGQRQLASLAQSIVRDPEVLLLDEPTSALDIRYAMRVMQVVEELAREKGTIVIVVVHDIALASRWCRRLVVIADGKVAADGSPDEAVTPEMLANVYGVEARVERCSRGTVQIMVDRALP